MFPKYLEKRNMVFGAVHLKRTKLELTQFLGIMDLSCSRKNS